MFKPRCCALLIFTLLCFAKPVNSEQISFSKNIINHLGEMSYQFNYQWQDHLDSQQSLVFILPQQTIFDRYRNFKKHSNNHIQHSVHHALQKYFKNNPASNINIRLSQQLYPRVTGKDKIQVNEVYNKIEELIHKYRANYLRSVHYHQFITHDIISVIKPDHGRIAVDSVVDLKVLKPLILEKASIRNIRKVSNYVLGFIQNIPRTTLKSRITSAGASYTPPLKVLFENQGDCDSKLTLAAALLRTLMPRVNLALIFIDNNALIGIDLQPNGDDITIEIDGISYVVAETSGPDSTPIGKLAPNSARAILAGHFAAEKINSVASL